MVTWGQLQELKLYQEITKAFELSFSRSYK